ncbi:MAG: alcohol dehydrogenase catalytic domain-containing protein [Candidatus Sumerlaeia bacterium]
MTTVKAAVMTGPGRDIEVREFARPALEPGAVLLETLYSEVCGTDCHLRHGRLAGVPYPIIPGHVSVGRIAEMGGQVCDVHGAPFRPGDIVAFLDVHETCGRCWHCLVAKASTRCPSRRVYGITYSADEGLLGGWSQMIYLKPGVRMLRLPEGVRPETYIAGGCGLPTAFHAVERAGVRMGDTVAVQGCGPVGLCAVVLARLAGAAQVILIGAPAARLDVGRQFGADALINIEELPEPDARIEAVRAATGGRGADVTIEATGSPAALPEGCRMTRDAGVYVVVGQYTDNGPALINPHLDINKKHLEIRGCWGCDFSHLYRALVMMGRTVRDPAPVRWEAMISRIYGLEEVRQALDDVAALRVVKAVINPQMDIDRRAAGGQTDPPQGR